MTPTYQDSSPSPFPIAISEDHDQDYDHLYSSSLSSHVFTYPIEDQQGFYQEVEANTLASEALASESDRGLKLRLWAKENRHDQNQSHDQSGSAEWMPWDRKLIRNTMNSDRPGSDPPNTIVAQMKIEDHKQQAPSPVGTDNSSNNSSSSNSNIPRRVCADCNTTTTPLWRSGPRGPKSLCNACGIRRRKARQAMVAAAAVAGNGTVFVAENKVQHKDKKRLKNGSVAKYKKRAKQATNTSHVVKKVCFEDFLISLSKNLAFHSVFPQDEKEAAILLMALSCGLVHG